MEPWTAENGLLTASGKLCRPKLKVKYQEVLENTYNQLNLLTTDEFISLIKEALRTANIAAGRYVCNCCTEAILDDTFVSLGGDSLTAVQLVKTIKEKFEVLLQILSLTINSDRCPIEFAVSEQYYNCRCCKICTTEGRHSHAGTYKWDILKLSGINQLGRRNSFGSGDYYLH